MDIDLNNLGIFAKIAPGAGTSGTEVVNLSKNDKVSSGGTYKSGRLFSRWFRDAHSRRDNNTARTKLLLALGNTLNIGGMDVGEHGQVTFSQDFIEELEAKLGRKVLETGDFKVKDGVVTSGRPLTERRVMAIVDRVRELAVGENGEVVGADERKSIADLQTDQAAELLEHTKYASRNKGIFDQAVCALLGRPEESIAQDESQQFESARNLVFQSCQDHSANAAKFDSALDRLNAMRAPGCDPITVQSLEWKVKELLVAQDDAAFKQMSLIDQLKYVKTEKGQAFLALKHEVNSNCRMTSWLQMLIEHRAISSFIEETLPQVKLTLQDKFMQFCVNRLAPDKTCFYMVSLLLAYRFGQINDRLPDQDGELKASEVWKAIFEEPVPEGIDNLGAEECTERFYQGFKTQLVTAMKVRYPDIDQNKDNGKIDLGLCNMANAMKVQGLSFDLALKIQAGQFDAIKLEDLKGKVLYDPSDAKTLGMVKLTEQWGNDFKRGGLRIDFPGGVSLRFTKDACQRLQSEPKVPVEFQEQFNSFTADMSEEQKLVIGFGLTQAGVELHGSLFGDGGTIGVVHDLSKDADGKVLLKFTFPAMPNSGVDQVSYAYRIKSDGASELVAYTYGDPKNVQ